MHTWITISQAALLHNLRILEQLANPAEVGCVVKNNAYGHDVSCVVQMLLHDNPNRYLFTVDTQEAVYIKQKFPYARVCAMAFITTPIWMCAAYDIACVVYSRNTIDALQNAARTYGTCLRVHLKVDTGMHRLGVAMDDVGGYIHYIQRCSHVQLEGVITHLADLALEHQPIANRQIQHFYTLYQQYAETVSYWHAGSSGSVMKTSMCNLIRIGSALYGIPKSYQQQCMLQDCGMQLQPIMRWYTRVVVTKWVSPGDPVGYDGAYVPQRPTRIALLPIGYGDGYPRSLSDCASVYIHDSYAPVIGRIGMNITTIDITDIPQVQEGDVVTLLGSHEKIHPVYLAQQSGRITLEVLSNINSKIPRVIAQE